MKRFPFFKMLAFVAATVLFISCEKDDDPTQMGTSKLAIVHAAAGTASFDVLLNNNNVGTTGIPFGSNSGTVGNPYVNGTTGLNNVSLSVAGNRKFQANFLADANLNYTVFVHDTLGNGNGTTGLLLSDALVVTGSDSAFIRIIHLSHDAGAIDIELIQPGFTTLMADSVTYVGSNSNTAALSTFQRVRAGNYTFNVTTNGTTILILTLNLTIAGGKTYTLYIKGSRIAGVASPYAFGVGQLLHN